jgi:hypothetical protein
MSGMKRRNSTFCQSINCAVEQQAQPALRRFAVSGSDRRATPETQCPRQDLGDEVAVEQDILQSALQVVLPSIAPVAMADPLQRGVQLNHAQGSGVILSEGDYTAISHGPDGKSRIQTSSNERNVSRREITRYYSNRGVSFSFRRVP